ncbi:MBL fold metallo-hydrolase [Ideonella aquatica]|nr:MBL fold metallo-hydrolase [Ideonella aquatica]
MKRAVRGLLALLALGLVGWLAAAGRDEPPYRNLHGGDIEKPFMEVLRWRLSRESAPLPDPPLPAAQPQLDAPLPNLTWIGHATMLLRLPGLTLITDPQFSERASPFSFAGPKRAYPPGVALSALPKVDVVLISHNHYDHLDVASVQALAAQPGGAPLFVVPLGLKAWFADLGITNVVELGWWQSRTVNGAEIVLTPAHHWSARGVFDRRQTLWGGFAVFSGGLRLLYTGDTGYADDFKDIRADFANRGPFDLALIPVGCYEPRGFMQDQHVNPADAVRIFQDLGARRAVGVHWGTFADLCDEPLDQAPKDLAVARQAAGLPEVAFSVMRRGETRAIE